MPKKPKPTLGRRVMEKILREEETAVLSMCRGGEPYAVSVSYAFIDKKLVFHCALKGRKLDFIRANPRVCLSISRHPNRARAHHAEKGCTYRFESVLCFGRARVIEDVSARLKWLNRFKAYFYKRLGRDPRKDPVGRPAAERTGCVVITVGRMTGRRKGKR